MKRNINMACLVMAAAFCLNAAEPVCAAQMNPPGAGTINPGTGTTNALPGNALPARVPGNIVPGTLPGNTAPGALPGNTVPGALPRTAVPGTLPGNTAPGTLPGNAAPGTLPGNTAPGTLPGNNVPGTLPGNTVPGTQPRTALPGGANAPMQPGYTLPGNTAPGIINPASPYNNGTNLPGTSTIAPQVGGVTNDPDMTGEPWQKMPAKQNSTVIDPTTGRTRPLLKATPIPGEIDVYNVHLHDTLWIITQKYKTKLEAVIDANPELTDPDLIYPGDQIKVPLDPRINEMMDIADSNIDKGDGSTSIRSNIVHGRYSGITSQTQENSEEKELLDLVNNERAKAGLPSLKISSAVSTAARIKADEMSAKKYFNHTSPVYGSPFEMLHAFGITYRTAGENIAKGQKSARSVMGAWMNSEGHRANILNKDFSEIGIGYASDGKITYWVQVFIGK